MKNLQAVIVLLGIALWGCENASQPQPKALNLEGQVLVLNEGNFGWGIGTVTAYEPRSNGLTQSAFRAANGFEPGNVLHSGTVVEGTLFLVVNNSGLVYACNPASLKVKARIGGLTSPRHLLQVSDSLAYITDLYSNTISLLHLGRLELVGGIATHGWTEEMLTMTNGTVLVASSKPDADPSQEGQELLVIDPASHSISQRIALGRGLRELESWKDQVITHLIEGDQAKPSGRLVLLDQSLNTAAQLALPKPIGSMATIGDTLFYLSAGQLWRCQLSASALGTPQALGTYATGYKVHAVAGQLYVCDAKDYVQRGQVFVLSTKGQLQHEFQAGIIPGAVIPLP